MQDGDGCSVDRTALHVEDALILLAIPALFVLTVFYRNRWWGQAGLVVILIVMAAVFVCRLRRANRAFTEHDEA